ncbi:hypothetical protein WEI85_21535 [Actinomycetes bacterium KLBMP 9797]
MKTSQLRQYADRLGFRPQEAVRWLSPAELWRTAVKVMLSSIFADYSDKREIQAALPATLLECAAARDAGEQSELWLDFVADLGDGFDATYTVATLLARDKLEVNDTAGTKQMLPRGSLLVLGGDAVYPTASPVAYEDRTKGPYRAALPSADNPPLMVALPGNHDWYDGLTAFLRMFTQGRFIGGWRTAQTRSYFAVRLPHRWWLLGLDSQFGTYIDEPQVRFFQQHVSSELRPGDGIIMCVANPSWVRAGRGDVDAFNSLHFFDQQVVRNRPDPRTGQLVPTGARIRLWITGDSHHYAHYAEDPPTPNDSRFAEHMVTCGMGGAYLSATHTLPPALDLPPPASRIRQKDPPTRFALRHRYPDDRQSRRLSWGLLVPGPRALPFRNPGFWRLAGALHGAFFLTLIVALGLVHGRSPVDALRFLRPADALAVGGWLLMLLALGTAVLLLYPLLRGRMPRRPEVPLLAVAPQVAVAAGGLTGAVAIPWPAGWSDWLILVGCLLGTVILTGLVASFAFAAYIRLARSGLVQDWQMSAQSIEDHKGFVRMHINPEGDLTLYPLVVDTVCRDWTTAPDDSAGGERPMPAEPLRPPKLIHPPIVIARNGPRP